MKPRLLGATGWRLVALSSRSFRPFVSVHKSQGSEYPAIVMPVHTQHYMLLQRNLIYTALTRERRLVVMVGTKKALAIGINNNRTQKRYTYLKNRLKKNSEK